MIQLQACSRILFSLFLRPLQQQLQQSALFSLPFPLRSRAQVLASLPVLLGCALPNVEGNAKFLRMQYMHLNLFAPGSKCRKHSVASRSIFFLGSSGAPRVPGFSGALGSSSIPGGSAAPGIHGGRDTVMRVSKAVTTFARYPDRRAAGLTSTRFGCAGRAGVISTARSSSTTSRSGPPGPLVEDVFFYAAMLGTSFLSSQVNRFRRIGLEVNLDKTEIISPWTISQSFGSTGLPGCFWNGSASFKLLGAAVGPTDWCEDLSGWSIAKVPVLLDAIGRFPDALRRSRQASRLICSPVPEDGWRLASLGSRQAGLERDLWPNTLPRLVSLVSQLVTTSAPGCGPVRPLPDLSHASLEGEAESLEPCTSAWRCWRALSRSWFGLT